MRLTRKLILALVLAIGAVLAAAGWFEVRRGVAVFESDMRGDALTLATTLADSALALWRADGQDAAVLLVESSNWRDDDFLIRWIWLDEPVAGLFTDFVPGSQLERLRRGQPVVWHEVGDGGEMLHTFVPVRNPGPRPAAVEVGLLYDRRNRYRREEIIEQLTTTAALAVVCAAVVALLGFWFVGRPVRALVSHAQRVGSGDFTSRVDEVNQRDEIGQLAHEMNTMAERLARLRKERATATEQLRHADRLSTVGRLASGVAHELGTPLAVVAGRAEMIAAGEVDGADAVASAKVIVEQATRMTGIIRQLLDFARRRGARTARHDLQQIAASTVALLAPLGERRKARLRLASAAGAGDSDGAADDGDEACVALVDAGQLQQVLTNLIVNAFDAMPDGGEVVVTVGRRRATPPVELGGPEGDYFAIAVRDQGVGIAADALPHVFEPFFTTKDVGSGTGLGLSVSYGLVRDQGGWIEATTELGHGSTFTVLLPVARESAVPAELPGVERESAAPADSDASAAVAAAAAAATAATRDPGG